MKKICYSDRSRNEAEQYLENQQRKEKPAMAPKVAFLAILAVLPILGFVCRNPFQAPSSGQNIPTSQAPTPTGWKEYRNTQMGYSVQIPADWNARDITGDGTLIGLNKGPVPLRDVIDSIRIEVKQNPKKLTTEVFYRQSDEIQLFEDAKGGVEKMVINGRSVTWFRDVIGLVNVDVVVIPVGTRMIESEISDLDTNKSIFDFMLQTLSVWDSNV